MAAITIRNVPEHVRDELAARAERKGKSLQQYLLGELVRIVEIPDPDDYWDRVEKRTRASTSTVTTEDILEALREVRGS